MKTSAQEFRIGAGLLAALAALLLPLAAYPDASEPWSLRNLYHIPIERGVLVYAEDNAEWRVLLEDGEVLADRVGFSVVLDDGTEIVGAELPDGTPGRERFDSPLGKGMVYSVTFAPVNGVQIVHSLRTFHTRPFAFIEIALENVGPDPVRVERIRPVRAEQSVMQALSAQAKVQHRRVLDVGGRPVPAPRQDATMAVLHDPVKSISLGVGLIPRGVARSVVAFSERDGQWEGDVSSYYGPAKVLAPGEGLVSDPLWLSHGVPEPARVDLYYSWVYSTMVDSPGLTFPARGWYTLGRDQDLDAYVRAGAGWQDAGIDHVLIGRGWEGRPGSMEGAATRFPKHMSKALDTLAQAGLKPGVTLDPLSAREGGHAWTATSSGGLAWLDPSHPEGKAALAAKVGTVQSWGAAFVVVDYSLIPDEVLTGFGLTRTEAQNLAYAAVRDAAGPMPVIPATISSISDDLDQWLTAGSSVARMAVYGMVPGPLNCTLNGPVRLTEDLATAVQLWPGPIEFSGAIDRKMRADVLQLVQADRVAGQPVDAQNDSPRQWNVQRHDEHGTLLDERMISLSGAPDGEPRAARTESETGPESTS